MSPTVGVIPIGTRELVICGLIALCCIYRPLATGVPRSVLAHHLHFKAIVFVAETVLMHRRLGQQMLVSSPLAVEWSTNSEDLKHEFIRKNVM